MMNYYQMVAVAEAVQADRLQQAAQHRRLKVLQADRPKQMQVYAAWVRNLFSGGRQKVQVQTEANNPVSP